MHRFRIFPDLNLVVVAYDERIDDRGLLDHINRIYDDPAFVPGMDEVASFLATRDVEVTPDGLREIARSFPRSDQRNAPPNLVAVVTRTQLGRGLSRLYGAYADRDGQVTVEAFPSVAAAGDWLDAQRGRPPGITAAAAEDATRHG